MSSGATGIGGISVPGRPFCTTGADQLAILVVQHELRPEQVRAAELTAASVRAVAGAARSGEHRLAARDHRRIGRRTLMRRKPRLLPSSVPAALTAAGPRGGVVA